MENLKEHERQISALWTKVEECQKKAEEDKLKDIEWKADFKATTNVKLEHLEKWFWALITVTVLAVVSIAVKYAFDFIPK